MDDINAEHVVKTIFEGLGIKNQDLESWDPKGAENVDWNDEDSQKAWLEKPVSYDDFVDNHLSILLESGTYVSHDDVMHITNQVLDVVRPLINDASTYEVVEGHEMGGVPIDESEWRNATQGAEDEDDTPTE